MPTVERVVRHVLRRSMAMAGGMPSMRSTCGLSMPIEKLPRVGREGFDVTPLALRRKNVSNASELLPDPLKPVMTVAASERQIEIEILQVVVPHPAQADGRHELFFVTSLSEVIHQRTPKLRTPTVFVTVDREQAGVIPPRMERICCPRSHPPSLLFSLLCARRQSQTAALEFDIFSLAMLLLDYEFHPARRAGQPSGLPDGSRGS